MEIFRRFLKIFSPTSVLIIALLTSSADMSIAGLEKRYLAHFKSSVNQAMPTQIAPLESDHTIELKLDTKPGKVANQLVANQSLMPEATVSLSLDDGTADNNIGANDSTRTYAYQFLWFNRFTPQLDDYPFALNQIWLLFAHNSVQVGDDIDLVVYEDLDGAPPNNAIWRATISRTVQTVDGSNWSVYNINPPIQFNGPGDVLIGVINRYINSGVDPASYPAAIDQSSSQNRSWYGSWTTDPPNPPYLPANNHFDIIDNYDFPGNWLIRGYGETLLPAPILIAPSNGSIINNTPQFDWSSVSGATLYEIQVDNQSNFSNPEINTTTSDPSFNPLSALPDNTYYWRVRARNGSDLWSLWSSPTWSFTITSIVNVFLPISLNSSSDFFEGPDEVEPNNTWQQANGPIRSGKDYFGFPDLRDYFSFYMNNSGSISIGLENHTGQEVQLQLFHQQDTSNPVEADTVPPFNIELSNQPPGWYYIYIFSNSGHNNQYKYKLNANYP